jgi:4-hydroxy-2-oxoheptanedioate aldolase
VAPYVETPAQVAAVGGAVKLRPLRGERLAEATARPEALDSELNEYVAARCAGSVVIANIESLPAMQNLDAIVRNPHIDALLIGPHDLSVSLGVPERYGDPKFDSAVREIVGKGRAAGIGVGIHFGHCGDESLIRPWMEAGMNMLVYSADVAVFARGVARYLQDLKEQLGEATSRTGTEDIVI